jgi:8-oxo-dGTP pyrophosphatase MutT (NUDIX family)
MTGKIQEIYRGKIVRLCLENAVLPDGQTLEMEIVHHPGGVAIVAEETDGRLCLIRQYRHAIGQWLWEFPAGKLETGEAPDITARRELLEETGVEAVEWQQLGQIVSSPGVFTEWVHIYRATGLSKKNHAHEHGELIEIHWFTPAEIQAMVSKGQLVDSKTLAGLYLLNSMCRGD